MSFLGNFPSAGKSEELSALLFYVVHCTEISLDKPPIILWESVTEKSKLEVSNDPLNASLIDQQLRMEKSFLVCHFLIRLFALFSRQLGNTNEFV